MTFIIFNSNNKNNGVKVNIHVNICSLYITYYDTILFSDIIHGQLMINIVRNKTFKIYLYIFSILYS